MSEDLPPRLQMLFADASANLLAIKQHQWTVLRDAFAAYAAIYALSSIWEPYDVRLLVGATWLVFFASALFLGSLIGSLAKFRRRIRWIYDRHFPSVGETSALQLDEKKGWFNREGLVWVFVFATWFGALLTTLAILRC